jgi:hypothetical protein
MLIGMNIATENQQWLRKEPLCFVIQTLMGIGLPEMIQTRIYTHEWKKIAKIMPFWVKYLAQSYQEIL